MFDFPSRLDSIDITISGDEVARPIKIKLDKNMKYYISLKYSESM